MRHDFSQLVSKLLLSSKETVEGSANRQPPRRFLATIELSLCLLLLLTSSTCTLVQIGRFSATIGLCSAIS